MCNTACLTHHDQSIPNLVCPHYPKFRSFQERTEKHTLLLYYHFSRGNGTCSSFIKTRFSQLFFHTKKGRYACHIGVQYPRGDSSYHTRPRSAYHELSRASARVQENWVILKSARSAHTTEHATHGTRELAQTGAPAGFFLLQKSVKPVKDSRFHLDENR